MPGIIIPRKTVGELQKLVDNPEVVATVEVSDAKIRLTIGGIVMTSKLIDGTFRITSVSSQPAMTRKCVSIAKALPAQWTVSRPFRPSVDAP